MKDYYVDVYTTECLKCFNKYNIREKNHPKYGRYYQMLTDRRGKRKLTRFLARRKIKYRVYEKRWERSSDYRAVFFQIYSPPYRCRYCNRKLKKEYMTIDHIVPVGKVKSSTNARMFLYIQGISDVNDARNLAPSCYKCNKKKDMKLGLWWVKGMFGKYKLYWVLRKAFFLSLLLFAAFLLMQKIPLG